MGLGIPPLNTMIMSESNPLKSIILVRRLAVKRREAHVVSATLQSNFLAPPKRVFKWLATRNRKRSVAFHPKVHFEHMFESTYLKHAKTKIDPGHSASMVTRCQPQGEPLL